jgi:GcrA cell cycle regulator
MAEREDGIEAAWSLARVDLLRLHFELGLSAKLSAELIGGVTRNAVISKRRRLGLMGANPLQTAMRLARRAVRIALPTPRRPSSPAPGQSPPPEPICCEPLPFMDWPAPAGARPKTLAEREQSECAWPLGPAEAPGDYRTLFCCAPAEAGRSYCTVHHLRAFSAAPACAAPAPRAR